MRRLECSLLAYVVPVASYDFFVFAKASLQGCILPLERSVTTPCEGSMPAYMREHHDIIFRHMNVRFYSVGANFDRAFECAYCIFWIVGLVTSMSDSLRELAPVWALDSESP